MIGLLKLNTTLVRKENLDYEIIFYCGEYFKKFINIEEPLFIDDVIIRFGINSNEPSRGYPYPQGLISRLAALSETVGLGDRSPSKQSEEVYKKLNKTTIEFSNKIEKLSKETR